MVKNTHSGAKTKQRRVRKVKKLAKQIATVSGKGKYAVRHVGGRGNFFTDIASAVARPFLDSTESKGSVNHAARSLGEAVGGIVPIPGAGRLLGNAGSWLSRLLGQGNYYPIRKNSLVDRQSVETMPAVAAPPVFGSIAKGADITFAHREFVADILSSSEFTATTYPLNPGNPNLFPWMSKIASLYEEYEFLGVIFEYRPTSATAVGTTSSGMGVVLMATDYDCYDSNFTSKRAMEAAEYSSSAVPYQKFIHPIECDPKRNVLRSAYIVPGITTASSAPGDQRMSVHGNFTIATEGQPNAGNRIGELWISYHIRLSRPVLEPLPDTDMSYGHFHVVSKNAEPNADPGQQLSANFPWTANFGNANLCILTYTGLIDRQFMIIICAVDPDPPGFVGIAPLNIGAISRTTNLAYGGTVTPYSNIVSAIAANANNTMFSSVYSVGPGCSLEIPLIVGTATKSAGFDIFLSETKFQSPAATEMTVERRLLNLESMLKTVPMQSRHKALAADTSAAAAAAAIDVSKDDDEKENPSHHESDDDDVDVEDIQEQELLLRLAKLKQQSRLRKLQHQQKDALLLDASVAKTSQ